MTGVILMTYGSATTSKNVVDYLAHVYRKPAPADVIADFEERYDEVGGSPLVAITADQARLLEASLNSDPGGDYIVRVGMLHSPPFIDGAVQACHEAGVERIIGVILSPQYSSLIMDGYRRAMTSTAEAQGYRSDQITIAEPWPVEASFIKLLANRIAEAKKRLNDEFGEVPVIYTTHSLPARVVEQDPGYLDQLAHTFTAINHALEPRVPSWYAAYQSAGHTPEVWLKPDLVDILADLRDKQTKTVLIVPIQFLSDHLEILYDLDVAARAQCQQFGINYHRTELPNLDPMFVQALANIVALTETKTGGS